MCSDVFFNVFRAVTDKSAKSYVGASVSAFAVAFNASNRATGYFSNLFLV